MGASHGRPVDPRAEMERQMARQLQYQGMTLEQMFHMQNNMYHQGPPERMGPPPAVSHTTHAIRNDVHVHKSSIKLVPSDRDPELLHLECVVDAATPCSVTILFCVNLCDDPATGLLARAAVGTGSARLPAPAAGASAGARPGVVYTTHSYVLPAGVKQAFSQARVAGGLDGLDTRLFKPAQLYPGSDKPPSYFPLVLLLESVDASSLGSSVAHAVGMDEAHSVDFTSRQRLHSLLTLCLLSPPHYTVKPLGQKLQIDGACYMLEDVFGINSGKSGGAAGHPSPGAVNDHAASSAGDSGDSIAPSTDAGLAGTTAVPDTSTEEPADSTECVICLTADKDTVVLPCRHLCMCFNCANMLRMQSNKCPICRKGIQAFQQLKIS